MSAGFFAILDDVATLLDDAAAMSKVATEKTAGILGDDLAVNAQKASGFSASRELPVLWAITKGSFINKLIILPFAFLLSAFAPWAIVPILMVGGVYLAFEGAEKIYEYFTKSKNKKSHVETEPKTKEEILKIEKSKIKSAIITDFILSIEIVIIALGTVVTQTLPIQIVVVSVVAILATIGVYGIVAIIIRMDDVGYGLIEKGKKNGKEFMVKMGKTLVASLPKVIRGLTVIGTIAMLLVAGGIFVHNSTTIHHAVDFLPSLVAELLVGLIIGAVALTIEKSIMLLVHK
jgi:predicted DNA repair protein MutK